MSARRPRPLLVVCALVALESVAFLGLAAAFAADLLRGRAQIPGATVFLALFATGIAVLLALGARGLWRGRRWARSPVMTWQILLVVLAVGWLSVEVSLWAALVVVVALVVGIGLLLPPVVALTAHRPEPDAAA